MGARTNAREEGFRRDGKDMDDVASFKVDVDPGSTLEPEGTARMEGLRDAVPVPRGCARNGNRTIRFQTPEFTTGRETHSNPKQISDEKGRDPFGGKGGSVHGATYGLLGPVNHGR